MRVRTRRGPRSRLLLRVLSGLFLLPLVACGEDGVRPNLDRLEVVGSYRLSELSFDPDGSLGAFDVAGELQARGRQAGTLTLLSDGRLQLLYEDPEAPLLRLVEGSYLTTPEGVDLRFGSGSPVGELLLPTRLITVRGSAGGLGFEVANARVGRGTLRALFPELDVEPLSDPVPGRLSGRFTVEVAS